MAIRAASTERVLEGQDNDKIRDNTRREEGSQQAIGGDSLKLAPQWRRSMKEMKRMDQILLIGSFIGFSWLVMQAVHELEHVLEAVTTGGTVTKVVLHPFTISRTDVHPNPHALIEVWAGPIVGVLLPLTAFFLAKALRSPGAFLFRFFAGFCLVANGVYIGTGWLAGEGADAVDFLRLGATHWQLVRLGLLTVPLGFFLWHGLGPHFGLGKANGFVSHSAALTSVCLFILVFVVELAIGSK